MEVGDTEMNKAQQVLFFRELILQGGGRLPRDQHVTDDKYYESGEGLERAYSVNIMTKTAITTLLTCWGGLHVTNAFIDMLLFTSYLLSVMLGNEGTTVKN